MAGFAITGCELISSLGLGAETGHRRWTDTPVPESTGFALAGRLAELPEPWQGRDDRTLVAAWAVLQPLSVALSDASRRWGPAKVGVLVGASGRSTGASTEDVVELARRHARARGPAYAVTGGLSASGRALRSATTMLATSLCDAVLLLSVSGSVGPRREFWESRGELGQPSSGPFVSERSGLQPGEGAAAVLLERQGQCEVELRAVTSAADPADAIRAGLDRAGVSVRRLSWSLCGGDGRIDADRRLAEAVRHELPQCPVTSAVAHRGSLGAAQDLAAVVDVVRSVEVGRVGPLGTAESVDPQFGLRALRIGTAMETEHCMTLHAGVEGDFTAVVLGAREP